MRFTRFVRRVVLLSALPLVLLGIPAAVSTATAGASTHASAAAIGWLRLAHLSPNTPEVDVYLYSYGDSAAQVVLHHVGYGDESPYEQVPAGDYSVAMRAAGAAATSAPVLSASVNVTAGHAYTVAGLGPESGLRLQVLDDRLATPAGHALVRIIQASLKQNVVSVSWNGQVLDSSLKFASVSPYQSVSPATANLTVSGGGESTHISVPLAAGTVHTLVVLDGAKGLLVSDLLDAAGSSKTPVGAAKTGFGGMAPRAPSSPLPWLAVIGAGLLLALVGGRRLRGLAAVRSQEC
jgi:Domain of unknown function (DUF4397)